MARERGYVFPVWIDVERNVINVNAITYIEPDIYTTEKDNPDSRVEAGTIIHFIGGGSLKLGATLPDQLRQVLAGL